VPWFKVLSAGNREQVAGARDQEPGTRSQGPGAREKHQKQAPSSKLQILK